MISLPCFLAFVNKIIPNNFYDYVSDADLLVLEGKITSGSEVGYITAGYHLVLRRCVLQGIRETIEMYRLVKWKQIQDCVKGIIHELGNSRNASSDDQDIEAESITTEITHDSFSMEFCEQHRSS